MTRIYLSPPHLTGNERALVEEAFDSNWIAPLGPHVDAFEQEVAAVTGRKFGAALSSGTAGLHLLLRTLELQPDDVVITSTLTFCATVNPVLYERATPVFVDVHPDTWTIDPDLLEEEIAALTREGRRVRAIIGVDLYGQCADWPRLESIAQACGAFLIADAAEALGARFADRPAGAFGDAAVLSFNGNKIITTSGGGMVVSDDEALIARLRHLATQARAPAAHYEHTELGFNYRLSNILAAIGRGQLEMLDDKVARRRAIFERYVRELGGLPGWTFMPEDPRGTASRWLSCAVIDAEAGGVSRDEVLQALAGADIEARPVWKPMHLQPLYENARCRGGAVAADLFRRGLCLPSGSSLTEDEQGRVIEIISARAGGR